MIHGEAISIIADTPGFFAANSLENKFSVATVELKLNFLSPAKEKGILGRGKVLRKGRRLIVCSFEVRNSDENLTAVGLGSYIITDIPLDEKIGYK